MVKKKFLTLDDSWMFYIILAMAVSLVTTSVLWVFLFSNFVLLAIFVRYVFRFLAITEWNNAFQTRLGAAVISDYTYSNYRNVDKACDDAAFSCKDWAVARFILPPYYAQRLIVNYFYEGTIWIGRKPRSNFVKGILGLKGNDIVVGNQDNLYKVFDKTCLKAVGVKDTVDFL